MFNEKDILSALDSGKSFDEVAKEITAAMNAAKAIVEERERKQKEEDNLQTIAENMVENLIEYVSYKKPEVLDEIADIAICDLAKTWRECIDVMLQLMITEVKKEEEKEVKPSKKPVSKKYTFDNLTDKDIDDILYSFTKNW